MTKPSFEDNCVAILQAAGVFTALGLMVLFLGHGCVDLAAHAVNKLG